ncbi:MAG: MltA domain-containing protein, partial [Betaproteobacteria bacterium]|nr:MltA domain-containing protein [Betaproteobacteria bacterium]
MTPAAWRAFLQSCGALGSQAPWQESCTEAARLPNPPAPAAMRAFFERHFTPWLVVNGDGSNTGLVTGYYEPLLHGSRTPGPRYRYPVYA